MVIRGKRKNEKLFLGNPEISITLSEVQAVHKRYTCGKVERKEIFASDETVGPKE